jgi:hypothetical protein
LSSIEREGEEVDMLKRTTGTVMAAGLAALLSPAAVHAQGAASEGPFVAQQSAGSLRLSQMKGIDVIGQDHVKLGDIEDLLIDRSGRVQAVVVDSGGVLGVGGKSVALPYDQIVWNTGEAARVQTPSASLHPADAPMAPTGQAVETANQRMPGAEISERVLNAVPEGRSGVVDPSTGPVTTGATNRPATVSVVGGGGPERAFARLTKPDFEQAPAFHYSGDAETDSRGGPRR